MLLRFRRHFRAPKTVIPAPPDAGPVDPGGPRRPPFLTPSLASATRDYAQAIDMGRLDRMDARDLGRLAAAMGPDLWAWQRARRLTSQVPWRASATAPDRIERVRAAEQMTVDIPTWERALIEVDAETRRATLYGKPLPPPLEVPATVMLLIEGRRLAALEQASRRRQRAEEARGGPMPRPEQAVDHPPTPTKPA